MMAGQENKGNEMKKDTKVNKWLRDMKVTTARHRCHGQDRSGDEPVLDGA